MDPARLDEILATEAGSDLAALDIRDLRTVRAECQDHEAGLSYVRRVVQARLDILGAEAARRAEGRPPTALDEMVAALPEILSDRVRSPGFGRLPQILAPSDVSEALVDLDELAPSSVFIALADLDEAGLSALTDSLSDYERSVSERRRSLHDLMDRLQAELIRRYREGEASVESLLS